MMDLEDQEYSGRDELASRVGVLCSIFGLARSDGEIMRD